MRERGLKESYFFRLFREEKRISGRGHSGRQTARQTEGQAHRILTVRKTEGQAYRFLTDRQKDRPIE